MFNPRGISQEKKEALRPKLSGLRLRHGLVCTGLPLRLEYKSDNCGGGVRVRWYRRRPQELTPRARRAMLSGTGDGSGETAAGSLSGHRVPIGFSPTPEFIEGAEAILPATMTTHASGGGGGDGGGGVRGLASLLEFRPSPADVGCTIGCEVTGLLLPRGDGSSLELSPANSPLSGIGDTMPMLVEQLGSESVSYGAAVLKLLSRYREQLLQQRGQQELVWDCIAVGVGGEEECRSAFTLFDRDDSGIIDVQELQALAKELGARLSAEQARQVFAQIDTDQSGGIDVDEFTTWWKGQVDDDSFFFLHIALLCHPFLCVRLCVCTSMCVCAPAVAHADSRELFAYCYGPAVMGCSARLIRSVVTAAAVPRA